MYNFCKHKNRSSIDTLMKDKIKKPVVKSENKVTYSKQTIKGLLRQKWFHKHIKSGNASPGLMQATYEVLDQMDLEDK